MALITCAECGHTVSTKAAACPKCGVPVAGMLSTTSVKDKFAPPEPVARGPSKAKLAGGLILLALMLGGGAYAYSAHQQRAARIAAERQQQEEARITEETRKAEEQAALEAEERGFASVDEMRDLQQRGFQTKADYVEAQQREQAEARERQLAEERARDPYPYTAYVTCGFGGGSQAPIIACFAGGHGVHTELELKNGDQYHLYKPWELNTLGPDTDSGVRIPLAQRFELSAQNASEHLKLGVRILENSSGDVLFEKQVGQFGAIRVSN